MKKKISDRLVGGFIALAVLGGATAATVGIASAVPEPASVTETSTPLTVPSDAPNGLAAEQEAEAAAVEAARVAAGQAAAAEAARLAAEAAAAAQAEADRIAAEQAALEAESFEESEPEVVDPEPVPEFSGPTPGTAVHTICQVLEDGTQVPCAL
jgi:nucleoid-associated protein YgaU